MTTRHDSFSHAIVRFNEALSATETDLKGCLNRLPVKLCGLAGISLGCTSVTIRIRHAGCSKRLSSKAAASEEATRTLCRTLSL